MKYAKNLWDNLTLHIGMYKRATLASMNTAQQRRHFFNWLKTHILLIANNEIPMLNLVYDSKRGVMINTVRGGVDFGGFTLSITYTDVVNGKKKSVTKRLRKQKTPKGTKYSWK